MFTQGTKEKTKYFEEVKNRNGQGFPGGTAAKTPHPQCRSLGLIAGQGCSAWGHKESDTTERLSMRVRAHTLTHTHTHSLSLSDTELDPTSPNKEFVCPNDPTCRN